ncbi:hypothetical protein ACFSTC_06345 [Nonomuraea ferruginea]
MKRILIPAGGAVLATGLLAAGLAGTAQANNDVATDAMAKNAAAAKAIASFWADNNGAALKAAKESNVWDKTDVTKLQSKGGYSADTKAGSTAPPSARRRRPPPRCRTSTCRRPSARCSSSTARARRSGARLLRSSRSTATSSSPLDHCVYDVKANSDVMDKWVFVPGYYQGKSPFGIYVGKQAFTHYDFDVYEDFDRDYAFVTVYNGVKLGGGHRQEGLQGRVREVRGPQGGQGRRDQPRGVPRVLARPHLH